MTTTTIDLDRQRAEFEAKYGPHDSFAWRTDDDKYKVPSLQSAWEIWQAAQQAALARHSQPVEAQASADDILRATAKRICDRWDAEVPSEEISEEHRDLRAALAAKGQQEPAAWIACYDGVKSQNVARTPKEKADVEEIGRLMNSTMKLTWEALYAAPVAQQSEALDADEMTRLRRLMRALGWDHERDESDKIVRGTLFTVLGQAASKIERQSEAGAPTAPAEVPRELLQRCLTAMKHAVTFGETGKGRPPSQTCMFEIEELEAYLAARESAAPAAPVREGDREQDAKDAAAKIVRDVCELDYTGEDWDAEKMLSVTVEDLGLIAERAIDAAMQKGAQDNG